MISLDEFMQSAWVAVEPLRSVQRSNPGGKRRAPLLKKVVMAVAVSASVATVGLVALSSASGAMGATATRGRPVEVHQATPPPAPTIESLALDRSAMAQHLAAALKLADERLGGASGLIEAAVMNVYGEPTKVRRSG